jgi:hypothetical protein
MNMFFNRSLRAAICVLVPLTCANHVRGQCQTWSTEFPHAIGGPVYALQVFDAGTGPELWVGGAFCVMSTGSCEVGRWNGHDWVDAPYLDDAVLSFGVHDDGTGASLYAGGYFFEAIQRFNGSTWVSVGGGLNHGPLPAAVTALASYDAGNGAQLYAGGSQFYRYGGGGSAQAIMSWNGQMWAPLGSGLTSATGDGPLVLALHVFDDGSGPALYVGGHFTMAGGVPVNGLARWDGTQWSAVGSNGNHVNAFATFDDGSGPALYAAGTFQLPRGGNAGLARWDGLTWIAVSFPAGGYALTVSDDGNGSALVSEVGLGEIAEWNGQTWTTLGSGVNGSPMAFAVFDEGQGNGPELFVGGQFSQAGGGISSIGIAKWITCNSSIESFCPGDATLAHCPCQNFGQSGHGCDNSIASGGAQLSATGATSTDSLVLTSSYELPNALSIFLQGNAVTQFVQPFGDGLRCIGGQLLRLFVKNAHNGTAIAPRLGDPSISARSAALGDPIAPGSMRYYQVYYRDPNQSFCPGPTGATFNASNGMRVLW